MSPTTLAGLDSTTDEISAPLGVIDEKLNLRVRGTYTSIRAFQPRLRSVLVSATPPGMDEKAAIDASSCCEPPAKRNRQLAAEITFGLFGIPRLVCPDCVPRQTLRFSGSKVASAAGIHPFTDVGDLFVDFVYQDLPDLLLHDVERAGVEVVSSTLERIRLMVKSG